MSTIKQALDEIMTLDGAMCAALVDSSSGMIMGQIGSGVDLEAAAAGNTEVVRAKLKTMRSLGLNDVIEDRRKRAGVLAGPAPVAYSRRVAAD